LQGEKYIESTNEVLKKLIGGIIDIVDCIAAIKDQADVISGKNKR
jgi:hypothetical protein